MLASWHGFFAWYGWPAFVALGTILLAFGTFTVALLTRSTATATGKLAAETGGLVEATKKLADVSAEEVEMSRRALQAEVKPLIADWPADNRQVTYQAFPQERVITVPCLNPARQA